MMVAENCGKLYKNPKFTEGSNLPRYIGECEVNGTKKAVAAWVRRPKNGTPYIYINFGELRSAAAGVKKVIPTKSKNKDGIRKLDKIAAGKKKEEIKPADMEISDIPF